MALQSALLSDYLWLRQREYLTEIAMPAREETFVQERREEDKSLEQFVKALWGAAYSKTKGLVLCLRLKSHPEEDVIVMELQAPVKSDAPARKRSFQADFEWIRKNAFQYRGDWIAIKEGKLLGNDRSRRALRSRLKEAGLLKGAAFFKVEE